MKITDLVPRVIFDELAVAGEYMEALYAELERQKYDNADLIIESLTNYLAVNPSDLPIIEFACVDVLLERYPLSVTDSEFLGHAVKRYHDTAKRQGTPLRKVSGTLAKATPAEIKTSLDAYMGIPMNVEVNLCKIQGTGEYGFMRGVTLCSEDEIHFPIGIKPYQDIFWMAHDKATGYLIRHGINDMQESREILTNVMPVEDSTSLDGLGLWLSIMGDVTPPDDLGRLYKTITTSYVHKVTNIEDIVATMALYLSHTTILKAPQFRATSRKIGKATLAQGAIDAPELEPYVLKFRFEDGMSQRKKVDLRRSMVNRIAVQGIQDSLALKPLEDALQARFPMWLMLADRKEINATKAERVTEVSVASDLGDEIANLKNIFNQQMRIALDNKSSDKQKSAAMARGVQTARAIMAIRKDAGYFDINNAQKAGIFQNMDSTVLQDDGAQFDKLIEQLAQQGGGDE